MSALIWLSYVSLLVLSLLDNIRGPFFPEILADMHLNGTTGAAFFATTSMFAFVGSWSSHWVLKFRSSLFLLGIASLVTSMGFMWVAQVHVFFLMLIACALSGWGYGALNAAQNIMIFEAGAPRLRRRLYSGLHSMYGLAALFAPLTASGFRWLGFDWRQSFQAIAILPLLLVCLCLGLHAQKKRARVESTASMVRSEWVTCLTFALMMAGYLWGEVSISTRMVVWLRTDQGLSPDLANLYLSGFFLTLLAGRVFFSFVHFAGAGSWLILCLSACFSSLFYFLALLSSPMWMVACGLSMAPFFPVAMDKISTQFGQKSSQALGFVLGFGSLSIVAMHLTIGWLSDTIGITRALYVGPFALLAIAVVLSFVQLRSMPQRV